MEKFNVAYWFITIVLSVIAYFLVRFFYLVDEIRKDVKGLLIKESKRDEMLTNLKDDINEIKNEMHDYEKKLNHLEIELQRLKK